MSWTGRLQGGAVARWAGRAVVMAALVVTSCAVEGQPPRAAPSGPAPTAAPVRAAATPVSPQAAGTPARAPAAATPAPPARAVAATPAPADAPRRGGTLTVINPAPPPSLDALWETTSALVAVVGPVYSGLLQYDPNNNTEIVGDLATRWEVSADGKTVTFSLAEARWHDGKPVTAEDEVAKWKLWLNPPPTRGSVRGANFWTVRDVVAKGARTLEFQLKEPSNGFLTWIAHGNSYVLPRRVFEARQEIRGVPELVGSGPYRMERYSRGTGAVLRRNRDYFRPEWPYLEELRVVEIQDRATQLAAVLAGRVDMTGGNVSLTPADKERIEGARRGIIIKPFFRGESIALLMNMARKPFGDVRVRRAVFLAVDRQKAIRIVSDGAGSVGTLFPPSGAFARSQEEYLALPGFRPKDTPGGQDDLKRAKQLMAEAGYPDGFKTTIKTRAGFRDYVAGSEVFANELATKLGVQAAIVPEDSAQHFVSRARRDMDTLVLAANPLSPYPVGQARYWVPPEPGDPTEYNETNYTNKRARDLYVAQDRERDVAQRRKTIRELEDLLIEEAPFVTSHWPLGFQAFQGHVRNYESGWGPHNNHRFERVWVAASAR